MESSKKGYMKLKGFLAERGIKHKDMADLLEITVVSFSNKINRTSQDFTLDEVRKICSRFKIDSNEFFLE